MSLQDLLAFDAGPWHTTSSVWQRLAQGVDDAAEQLIRGGNVLPRRKILRSPPESTYGRRGRG
jgi:hypothetical protein